MKIKVLSDSTCDLSKELLDKYNIDVIPLTVVKDGKPYADGITITPDDIFAHVAAGGDLCSTTALNIGEYTDMFSKYSAEYDGIIHINIGSGFSSCYQNACLAAESAMTPGIIGNQLQLHILGSEASLLVEGERLGIGCQLDDGIRSLIFQY